MNARDRAAILARSRVLSALPTDARSILAEMLEVEHYDAGALVFEAGAAADAVLIVAAGELDVFVGDDVTPVRTVGQAEVLGEYGMFGRGVRTATVRARGTAVLLSVPYGRFRELLIQFPTAMWALFGIAVQRLTALEARETST